MLANLATGTGKWFRSRVSSPSCHVEHKSRTIKTSALTRARNSARLSSTQLGIPTLPSLLGTLPWNSVLHYIFTLGKVWFPFRLCSFWENKNKNKSQEWETANRQLLRWRPNCIVWQKSASEPNHASREIPKALSSLNSGCGHDPDQESHRLSWKMMPLVAEDPTATPNTLMGKWHGIREYRPLHSTHFLAPLAQKPVLWWWDTLREGRLKKAKEVVMAVFVNQDSELASAA